MCTTTDVRWEDRKRWAIQDLEFASSSNQTVNGGKEGYGSQDDTTIMKLTPMFNIGIDRYLGTTLRIEARFDVFELLVGWSDDDDGIGYDQEAERCGQCKGPLLLSWHNEVRGDGAADTA